MSWTRAVWRELEKDGTFTEYEQTISSNWIKNGTVYWPYRSIEAAAIKKRSDPDDNWKQFQLKYIKIADNDRSICDEYGNYVTEGEKSGEMDIICKVKKGKTAKGSSKVPADPPTSDPLTMPVPPQLNVPVDNKRKSNHEGSQHSDSTHSKKKKTSKKKKLVNSSSPNGCSSILSSSIISKSSPRPTSPTNVSDSSFTLTKPSAVPFSGVSQSPGVSGSLPGGSAIQSMAHTPRSSDRVDDTDISISDVSSVMPHSQFISQRKDSAVVRDAFLPTSNLEFQRIVLLQIAELKTMIVDLNKKFDNIGATVRKEIVTNTLPQPFDDTKPFLDFDRTLGDKKVFKRFVNQLLSIGGKDRQKKVSNMIHRLMTNKLQAKFNLAGSKGKTLQKLAIQQLNVYKAVIVALKRLDVKATEDETRELIGSVLKYAPYRLDGGKRKVSKIGAIVNEEEARNNDDDSDDNGNDGDDDGSDDESDTSSESSEEE